MRGVEMAHSCLPLYDTRDRLFYTFNTVDTDAVALCITNASAVRVITLLFRKITCFVVQFVPHTISYSKH